MSEKKSKCIKARSIQNWILWAFLFSLYPNIIFAKILKDEKLITAKSEHSFKKVCKALTNRNDPLIERKSISKLNCMGTVVSVAAFCEKIEAGNPYYLRAIVARDKVECLSGKRVILKYQCENLTDEYCRDAEIGCYKLKEKLAYRLKISHSSLVKEKLKRVLNCYYDLGTKLTL